MLDEGSEERKYGLSTLVAVWRASLERRRVGWASPWGVWEVEGGMAIQIRTSQRQMDVRCNFGVVGMPERSERAAQVST